MTPFLEGFARAQRRLLDIRLADCRVPDEWVKPHPIRSALGRGLVRLGTRLIDDHRELDRAA